jgi:hypothetical protein
VTSKKRVKRKSFHGKRFGFRVETEAWPADARFRPASLDFLRLKSDIGGQAFSVNFAGRP